MVAQRQQQERIEIFIFPVYQSRVRWIQNIILTQSFCFFGKKSPANVISFGFLSQTLRNQKWFRPRRIMRPSNLVPRVVPDFRGKALGMRLRTLRYITVKHYITKRNTLEKTQMFRLLVG